MMKITQKIKKIFSGNKASIDYSASYNYRRAMEVVKDDEALAAEYLCKEIEEHPDNGMAHYWKANLANNHGMYGDAMASVCAAIRTCNLNDVNLSACYYLRASIYLALGNEDKMQEDVSAALKLDKNNTSCFLLLAKYYSDKDELDSAYEEYHRYSRVHPEESFPYIAMAIINNRKKKYDAAVDLCNYAIKLDPEAHHANGVRGEALLGLEKVPEAIDDLLVSIDRDRDDHLSSDILISEIPEKYHGLVALKLESMCQTKKDESIWPGILGNFYHHNKKYSEAISCYEEAFRRNETPFYLIAAALSCRMCCKEDLSLKYLDMAIAMNPSNDEYPVYRIEVLSVFGRFEEAAELGMSYLKLHPDKTDLYSTVAFCLRNQGKTEEALKVAQQGLVYDPNDLSCIMQEARCYKSLGYEEKTKSLLLEAIDKSGDRESYCSLRLNAYILLGDAEGAAEELRKPQSEKDNAFETLDETLYYAWIGDTEKAEESLEVSLRKEYLGVKVVRILPALKPVQELPHFEDIVTKMEQEIAEKYGSMQAEGSEDECDTETIELPFLRKGKMVNVRGNVNGLPLDFIFDTGCSDISISNIEADFMKKNGYLSDEDFGRKEYYRVASGATCEGQLLTLKELTIGGHTFKNVKASVQAGQRVPLLLGQSMMSRMNNFQIDNEKDVIRFTCAKM